MERSRGETTPVTTGAGGLAGSSEVKGVVTQTQDPLKVAAVLGDPTRYRIYQYILQSERGSVTAQEIARRFGLHPNVARMHLTKLADIGLLTTRAEKTGRGGRPVHTYSPTGQAVSVTVPARDYRLLSDLLSEALAHMGEEALPVLTQVGRAYGRRMAQEALQTLTEDSPRPSPRQLLEATARRLGAHGVGVEVVTGSDGDVSLVFSNCGFQEIALRRPEYVCHLCQGMVQGVAEECLPAARVHAEASLPRGDRRCVYSVPTRVPARLGGQVWVD